MKRPTYDLIDMIRTAIGFPQTPGHAVLSKKTAEDVIAELTRLYAMEDVVEEMAERYFTDTPVWPTVELFLERFGMKERT